MTKLAVTSKRKPTQPAGAKTPTVAQLQRAFDRARAAEVAAIAAVPETPPRQQPSPRAMAAADRAWAAAAETNAARAALTAARDRGES